MPEPLTISYDRGADVVTINGVVFAGKFFRELEEPDPEALYKIARDPRGSLTSRELFARPPAPADPREGPFARSKEPAPGQVVASPGRRHHRCPNWLIPYDNKPRIRCRLNVGHGTPCEFVVSA